MRGIYAPRFLLGVVVGMAIGIPVTLLAETNDMFALVLGSLAAAAIAGLGEVRTAVVAGSLTGAGLGLFLAARGQRFFAVPWAPAGPLSVLVHLVLGAIVCGLLGALYSFVTARLRPLFDEARGPHF
jgi:hypothetical protein